MPADRKWLSNLAVTEAIVDALRPYKKGWLERLDEIGARQKAAIEAVRSQQ